MKISMEFIRVRLKQMYNIPSKIIHNNPDIKYDQVCFYAEEMTEYKNRLLMCSSVSEEDTYEDNQDIQGVVWVSDTMAPCFHAPVLWIKSHKKECENIYNYLLEIFHFFQNWEMGIYRLLVEKRELQEVFECLSEVTINPWYFADSSFRIQAAKKDEDLEEMSAIWRHLYSTRHLPTNIIINIVENGELSRMNEAEDARILDTSVFNFPFVSKTIFSSKGVLGHFYIIGIYNTLTQYEIEIAECFGNILSRMLVDNNISLPTMGRFYDNYFIDLINGDSDNNIEILEGFFRFSNWQAEDNYYAVVFQWEGEDSHEKTVSGFQVYMLESLYPCKAFIYDTMVVAIFNSSKRVSCGIAKDQQLEQYISIILRDFGGNAGYSEIFSGMNAFLSFSTYFTQAFAALKYSLAKQSHNTMESFKNIVIYNLCDEIIQSRFYLQVYDFSLLNLKEYDAANHMELYQTLYCFLINERNAVKTAKELYIHRNSLAYRIRKINELTQLDLSDPLVRMRLLFSYYIDRSIESKHID